MESSYGDRFAGLFLFGSYARGDAELGSDVDLLVVLRGAVEPGQEIARQSATLAGLSLQYDVTVSCAFIAESRFRDEQSPFLLVVRRDGVAA